MTFAICARGICGWLSGWTQVFLQGLHQGQIHKLQQRFVTQFVLHLWWLQNDALVAQMEGMSHEEQQQFLAAQVEERVSLFNFIACMTCICLYNADVTCCMEACPTEDSVWYSAAYTSVSLAASQHSHFTCFVYFVVHASLATPEKDTVHVLQRWQDCESRTLLS